MRYERKYRVDDLGLSVVQQIVRMHPFSFKKAYPDRRVNNIYYDTPDHSTYYDNVAGVPERSKYRVRWYGTVTEEVSKPNFEVKFKRHLLGSKWTKKLEDFNLSNLKNLNQQVDKIEHNAGKLFPVLANAYHRSYYISSDGHFRITIDSQLNFKPSTKLGILQLNQSSPFGSDIIVELKYDEIYDDLADQVMQYIPFRNTKNSKYVTGLSLVMT